MNIGFLCELRDSLSSIGSFPMPHSIFIRERKGQIASPPELIAYDIDRISLANCLVRRIAKSFRANGYDTASGQRWFKSGDSTFEIYRWRQRGSNGRPAR
jgi:hypothetical protein